VAPPGANLRGRLDEQFGIGIGSNDGADIAPVEHRATILLGEPLLTLEQRGADERMCGHDGGHLPDLVGSQHGVGQDRVIEIACRDRIGLHRGVEFHPRDIGRDGAIEQAGVEMRQAIMPRQCLGDRALAARRGAVDRDDHALSQRGFAPSRIAVSIKAG